MSLGPELLAAVAACVAVLALIKRLSTFDLELRTHRAGWQRDFLRTLRRRIGDDASYFDSVQEYVESVRIEGERAAERGDAPLATLAWMKERLLLQELSRAESMRMEVPIVLLSLLSSRDAEQYAREWEAHLRERVEAGELREARVDRRSLVRYGLLLALTSRVRRFAQRARS